MNPAIYGDVLDGRRRTKNSTSRKTSTSAVTTEKSIMSFAATAATTISSAAVRHLSFGAFSRIPTPLFSLTRTNSTTSSNFRRMVSISNQNSPSTSEPEHPPEKPKPWLIVGLGNPGKLYSRTRHNVGFEMVDYIAEAEGISMKTVSFKALFGKGHIGNVPVMLAKPQTFMNASGESVGPIVSYYKIPLNQVLVIFDDMDLPFAKLRMLPKGGHGGHNGMRSIINHLKGKDSKDAGKDFPRLRIGIGRPPGKMNPVSFVMRAFDKQERQELDFTLQTGLEAVRILLLEGFNKSATFVNSPKTIEQLQ